MKTEKITQALLNQIKVLIGNKDRYEGWFSNYDDDYDFIVKYKIEHVFFRRPQVVCGMGGGSGKYYKQGKIRILKDRLRNWIVRSSSEYKKLFCIA